MRAAILVVALVACGHAAPGDPTGPAPGPDAALPVAQLPPLDLARPITAIKVIGLGPRNQLAREAIQTELGAVIDELAIRRDELAIWALGGVASLEVDAVAATDGVELVFRATERPRIRKVEVTGATQAALVDAERELGLVPSSAFDPLTVQRARERLRQAYEDAGYVSAEVAWSLANATEKQVDVAVAVTEGNRVTVKSIAFRGNKRLTTKQLLALVTKTTGAAVGGPYTPYAFDDGLVYLNAAYYDLGHIDVETGPAEVTYDADHLVADIVIPVKEGAQYKIGKVALAGNHTDQKIVGIKKGDVFSRAKVQAVADAIKATPVTEVDREKHTIDVTFEIE